MKLLSVEAIDVLGVESGVYSFAKGPEVAHERVLIIGGSGTGQTRLLELIVAAREMLAPNERVFEPTDFIRPGNQTSRAILAWQLTAEEQTLIGASSPVVSTEVIFTQEEEDEVDSRMGFLLERYGHDDEPPKFEYFSERRRLDIGGGEASLDEEGQIFLRSSPSPRKFSWVPTFLFELPDAPEKAARFAATLERFSPSCAYDLRRHVLSSRGRALGSLRELSASEADAVMFAATATLVGLSRSIVLVDRPELHGIDPVRALAGLSALGVDNQLILATASRAFATSFDGGVVQLDRDAASNRGQR